MAFTSLLLENGLLLDLREGTFPTQVYGFDDDALTLSDDATHYGIVIDGGAILHNREDRFRLRTGMFFVLPGAGRLAAPGGRGLVISLLGYRGLRQVGGPVERDGRIQYSNGSTGTLLAYPPRYGEPCLHHLHLPSYTVLPLRSFLSERIGVVLRGQGQCRVGKSIFPLSPGMGWYIPVEIRHEFLTAEESLDLIVWYPDVYFGPVDEI